MKSLLRSGIAFLFLAVPALPAPAAPVQLAASSHQLWLKEDGTVWGGGENNDGARGDAEEAKVYKRFKPIADLKDVVQIEVHDDASAALKADGTVWVWGMFGYADSSHKPRPLPGMSEIQAIASGDDFVVGVKRDGSVWLAGNDYQGLSGGNDASLKGAVRIEGLADVAAVGAATWTAYAVKKDGSVWGWGSGVFDLLGAGGKFDAYDPSVGNPKPLQIPGLANVVALSGGDRHMLALTRDGKVYAWGDNEDNALGDFDLRELKSVHEGLPRRVDRLPTIAAIAAGYDFSLALDREGKVWVWGNNTYGTLGVSPEAEESRSVPKPIQGIGKAVSVHGGHYQGFAVLADGKVVVWGSDERGRFLRPTALE